MQLIDRIRTGVRKAMNRLARVLNRLSRGKITPDSITVFGALAHVLVAWVIIQGWFLLGGFLLIIFGLSDALDGELARLQKKASARGMVIDASLDRVKEVIIYVAIAYSLSGVYGPGAAAVAVAALGGSMSVSYIKAKGETALAERDDNQLSTNEINRVFQDGLMRYEIRMALLAAGLIFDQLVLAVTILAVLAWMTALLRLQRINNILS